MATNRQFGTGADAPIGNPRRHDLRARHLCARRLGSAATPMNKHDFDDTRHCAKCGLPAEFVHHWRGRGWDDCFLPKPSPERMALIRSGAWRHVLGEFQHG
jgi:hypothetical protein